MVFGVPRWRARGRWRTPLIASGQAPGKRAIASSGREAAETERRQSTRCGESSEAAARGRALRLWPGFVAARMRHSSTAPFPCTVLTGLHLCIAAALRAAQGERRHAPTRRPHPAAAQPSGGGNMEPNAIDKQWAFGTRGDRWVGVETPGRHGAHSPATTFPGLGARGGGNVSHRARPERARGAATGEPVDDATVRSPTGSNAIDFASSPLPRPQ